MRFFAKLSERELDGILGGKAPDVELEDVAAFFRELRTGLEEPPPSPVEARQLAGIFEEARRPQPSASELQIPAPRAPRRLRNPFRRLAARATIAAVGLAALAAFGGAAYAGALPTTVQGKVADFARHVGLSLPGRDDPSKQPGGGQSPGDAGQPNVGQPSQGDGNQGNGNQGNGNQGNGDQTEGGQGTSNQTNGDQGNGDHGASTNDSRGDQTTTVRGGQNEQGTHGAPSEQGAPNEQGAPSGGSGADGQGNGAQGNGAGDGAGNTDQNG
jgi:hypothetical protein